MLRVLLLSWLTITSAFFFSHKHQHQEAGGRHCSSSLRRLNRILLEEQELAYAAREGNDGLLLEAHLPADDYRSKHICEILKLEVGDLLKCGVVDVGMCDAAKLMERNGTGSIVLSLGDRSNLSTLQEPPRVDLILAVPRPLRLERLLPVIACMGVNRLFLVGARKVEKDYFGSHLFRRPREVAKGFIEGLSQAATDYRQPSFIVNKHLRSFMNKDALDELFPRDEYRRVIAHPPPPSMDKNTRHRLTLLPPLSPSSSTTNKQAKVVIAVGPEGGWDEEEVSAFLSQDFAPISLGSRILRTDMAVPVLIGLAHEWLEVSDK